MERIVKIKRRKMHPELAAVATASWSVVDGQLDELIECTLRHSVMSVTEIPAAGFSFTNATGIALNRVEERALGLCLGSVPRQMFRIELHSAPGSTTTAPRKICTPLFVKK